MFPVTKSHLYYINIFIWCGGNEIVQFKKEGNFIQKSAINEIHFIQTVAATLYFVCLWVFKTLVCSVNWQFVAVCKKQMCTSFASNAKQKKIVVFFSSVAVAAIRLKKSPLFVCVFIRGLCKINRNLFLY